jgi:hypothetical protein
MLIFVSSTTSSTTAGTCGSSLITLLRGAKAGSPQESAATTPKVAGAKVIKQSTRSISSPRLKFKPVSQACDDKKYKTPNKNLLDLFPPKHVLCIGDRKIPVFSASALKSRLKLRVSRFKTIQRMFGNSSMELLNRRLKNHEIRRWSYMVGMACSVNGNQ